MTNLSRCPKIDNLQTISTTINNNRAHCEDGNDLRTRFGTPLMRKSLQKEHNRSFRVFEEEETLIVASSPKKSAQESEPSILAPEQEEQQPIVEREQHNNETEEPKASDEMDKTTEEKFVVNLFQSRGSKRWKRNSFLTSSKRFEQVRNEKNISLPTESLHIEESKTVVKEKLEKYKNSEPLPSRLQTNLSEVLGDSFVLSTYNSLFLIGEWRLQIGLQE